MFTRTSSPATRKLLLQFVLQEISQKKESKCLNEIISLSKIDKAFSCSLVVFFNTLIIDSFSLTGLVQN
jgi:hypothetical protein